MQVLAELIITLGAAVIAYLAIASESRARGWSGGMTTGIFLAVFGGIAMGFNQLWSLLQPKLVDEFAGENALLVIGLLGLALVIMLILDLTGRLQLMSMLRGAASSGQQQSSQPGGSAPPPPEQPRREPPE